MAYIQNTTPSPASDAKSDKTKGRGRSTIQFPYADLGAAITLAKTLQDKAATSCEVTQLATWMGQSERGGSFRSRYGASKMFGLVRSPSKGSIQLTQLGHDILDPHRTAEARVSAFFNIELYEALYEQLKGRQMPQAPALRMVLSNLGVTEKQIDRARQTFVKSAEVAQFIDSQTSAFIKPSTIDSTPAENDQGTSPDTENDDDGGSKSIDPIIQGLIDRLPEPGTVWSTADQDLWLEILRTSFKLVYKERDSSSGASTDSESWSPSDEVELS